MLLANKGMDEPVNGMYVLVLQSSGPKIKTRLYPVRGLLSPIKGVKAAGTIRASLGIGHPHKRDLGTHALVYLLAGEGQFEDDLGSHRRVAAGDLIWLFPGVSHAYGPLPGGRWDEILSHPRGSAGRSLAPAKNTGGRNGRSGGWSRSISGSAGWKRWLSPRKGSVGKARSISLVLLCHNRFECK